MSSRMPLEGIEPEQFDRLVDLLADWILAGLVKARFRLPSQIVLDFDEEFIAQQLKKDDLPEGCINQLKHDIPLVLSGILSGNRPAASLAQKSLALYLSQPFDKLRANGKKAIFVQSPCCRKLIGGPRK